MKRNLIVTLTLVALSILTVSASFAQNPVRADVPFAFQINKTALPAGTYTVSEISDHAILIRARENPSCSLVTNYNSEEKLEAQSPRLIFHKYGNSYFLAEVWGSNGSIGMQLPESKREKEMQATNWGDSSQELVVVAMK